MISRTFLPAALRRVSASGQAVAGEALGHPQHRLLVDHQPVGVAQQLDACRGEGA